MIVFPSLCGAATQDKPGVTLRIRSSARDVPPAASEDVRETRLVALYVPQGTSPSDFAPPRPFKATFEGDINLRLRDTLTFAAGGNGKLVLLINGKPALQVEGIDLSKKQGEPVRLNKGKNHFVAEYESPASGDTSLRLFWSSKFFRREPVPPTALTHDVAQDALARSLKVREGRFLLAELRCTKCHSAGNVTDIGMPELAMDAPSLKDAGGRLNEKWIAAWVAEPRALRPDAHMPRVFTGEGAGQQARDLAAYLASIGANELEAPSGEISNGGRLFANLDCLACHTAPDKAADDPSKPGRVPLAYVKAKFKPAALRAYLLNPESHYAWNPMPNFRLSAQEAKDLTTFLLSFDGTPVPASQPGDAAKGKLLVATSGCLNCHSVDEQKSAVPAADLSRLRKNTDGGCLAADAPHRGRAPDFHLSDEQRSALSAFLATDLSSLNRRCAPEFAQRQIAAMRCTACHARDGSESAIATTFEVESQTLHQKYQNPRADEAHPFAADQRPPMLTYAGEKLRPQWMGQFISGRIGYEPRYFLHARMPGFTARGELIAQGLAEEHGCPPMPAPNPKPNDDAEIGRKLVSKIPNLGFSCVQCHAVAKDPPFAPFEAPSVDFMYVSERLRHDYYLRWMHDPLRIDPTTKMPRFGDAQGKTGITAVFNGDAPKQYEAIWQYLLEGHQIQPPPQ